MCLAIATPNQESRPTSSRNTTSLLNDYISTKDIYKDQEDLILPILVMP